MPSPKPPAKPKPTIKPTKLKHTIKPAKLKPTVKPAKLKPTIKPAKLKPTVKPAKPKPTIKPKPAEKSTISGRVTGERRFVKKVGASNLDRPGQPITATVDASGHYRISNLPDGRYRVYPLPGGKFDLIAEPRHRDVRCRGSQSRNVDFEIKGIMEG